MRPLPLVLAALTLGALPLPSLAQTGSGSLTPAPGAMVDPPAPERLMDPEDLIGHPVVGAGGEPIGEVVDVMVNDVGAAHSLVVALDARHGAGREVAIPLERGQVRLGDDRIAAPGLTPEGVAALPEIDAAEGVVSLGGVPPADRRQKWPTGLAPLPGWFAEPQPPL